MKNITLRCIFYLLIVTTQSIISCPHDVTLSMTITDRTQHQSFLKNNEGPCVVLYHMDHCNYCTKMMPVFEKLSKRKAFEHIVFMLVNGPELEAQDDVSTIIHKNIDGYPTMLFFNHGKVVDEIIGAAPEHLIIKKLDALDAATAKSKKIITLAASKLKKN